MTGGLKLEKWCTCKWKAASQGTKKAVEGKDGREGRRGGKADGGEEVRGSTEIQL